MLAIVQLDKLYLAIAGKLGSLNKCLTTLGNFISGIADIW